MKKALVFLLLTFSTVAAIAQVQKKAVENAVDYLTCKLVELVMSDGDPSVFANFKASCNCSDNPTYGQVLAAIPSRQTKTKRLAREIQRAKESALQTKPPTYIVNFLSNKIFDDYANYPAIYEFATKRIENDDFYDVKLLLKSEINDYLQKKDESSLVKTGVYLPTEARDSVALLSGTTVNMSDSIPAADFSSSSTARLMSEKEIQLMQERLDALESAKRASAGLMDHTSFQIAMFGVMVLLIGFVFWKNKGAPLTRENQEEIKSFIDRKLLTKLGAIQNGSISGLQPNIAEYTLKNGRELATWEQEIHLVTESKKEEPDPAEQMPALKRLDLIFTLNDEVIVSKQQQDWQVWQETFSEYKSSLSFENWDELSEFLALEYNLNEADIRKLGQAVAKSNTDFLVVEFGNGVPLAIRAFQQEESN